MIRVACADDSAFLRQILKDILESSGKIKVIASLKNGKEALECAKVDKPDLMILDCEMPVMNGLEALRRIMQEAPLPVLMFSSLTSEGAAVTITALEHGAVDFLLKPTSLSGGLNEIKDVLVRKIALIASRNRFKGMQLGEKRKPSAPVDFNKIEQRKIDILAMGSSTGGVQAAMQVVPNLPDNCPPMVWVQHMPEHFTKSFADRLNGISKVKVKEAEEGDVLKQGHVYLGRGGIQMSLSKLTGQYKIHLGSKDKVNGFCPSCNVIFDSVAEYFGANALGIILTGMGNDGTEGLKKMHAKDSYVLGQDEFSSTVYGMPKAAFEAGVVDVQLPIGQIAHGIKRVCGLS